MHEVCIKIAEEPVRLIFQGRDSGDVCRLVKKRYNAFSSLDSSFILSGRFDDVPGAQEKFLPEVFNRDRKTVIKRWGFELNISWEKKKGSFLIKRGEVLLSLFSFDSFLRIFYSLYLLNRSGGLFHSTGIIFREKPETAFIFLGESGSGKSTIARMFQNEFVLSDELVALKCSNDKWCAYSTPFWGEFRTAENMSYGEIGALFFLKKSDRFKVKKLNPFNIVPRLVSTLLFFSKNRTDINNALNLVEKISGKIPAFELEFKLEHAYKEMKRWLLKKVIK